MSDQKAKADAGKPKVSLVPSAIVKCIAPIREYGCNKYPEGGKDNWKKVESKRYIDALYRHTLDFVEDPYSRDEESGLPHLWHIGCNTAFLCELLPMTAKAEEELEDPVDRSCEFCEHQHKMAIDQPCCSCKHAHENYFEPKVKRDDE